MIYIPLMVKLIIAAITGSLVGGFIKDKMSVWKKKNNEIRERAEKAAANRERIVRETDEELKAADKRKTEFLNTCSPEFREQYEQFDKICGNSVKETAYFKRIHAK